MVDVAPYRAVLAARVRAQRSYPVSFRLDLVGAFLVGFIELAEVAVLYRRADEIGGLDLRAVVLVFGIADLTFSLADLVVGHCDRMPTLVRSGTIDVFYLRPQPLLAQLVTSDISLRRLGRTTVGLGALVVGLAINDIAWSPAKVALLVVALASGFVMFAAMFVSAGGLQFFVINGGELTNSYVYGGRYAATQPASVWRRPVIVVFGFVLPMAFTAYLPSLVLLDLPGSDWLPAWLGWLCPLAAVWACVFAGLCWRAGVRHYQGAGG